MSFSEHGIRPTPRHFSARSVSESDQLVEQGHNRGCVGPPSDYCLGCSPVPEAGADPVGRKTPEIWERIDSISSRPRALHELGSLSGIVAAPADKSAAAAWFNSGGTPLLDDPAAGLASLEPLPVGAASGAGDEAPGGALSAAPREAPDGGVVPLAPDCGVVPGATGVSTLPRMIGRPSLPVPMITIFALCDCASARVASMPRQRKYESEIPWLTVCWKAAMPFASICLRFDSWASRSTRNLYS